MAAVSQTNSVHPNLQSRACRFCKSRKIKCDRNKPVCSSCRSHKQNCVYIFERPKPRPSMAIISAIQKEKQNLEDILVHLKSVSPGEAASFLADITIEDGSVQLPQTPPSSRGEGDVNGEDHSLPLDEFHSENSQYEERLDWRPKPSQRPDQAMNAGQRTEETRREARKTSSDDNEDHSDGEMDVAVANSAAAQSGEFDASRYLSVDDHGQVGVFGLTSTLHAPDKPSLSSGPPSSEIQNQLVANAAIGRQREFSLRHLLPDIDGVPINLAMHLLDLHWNRQHHTFLLTYRPAFMRDLVQGGPYCSLFLVNAVFACASKYSERIELRDDPSDPRTAGARFFRRCEQLIAENPPWGKSSIATVVGFLLLGSTFVSRGDISKGWSHSGFAMRMAFDLGLHLDCRKPGSSAEDVEIRRRVFWGAFICDKVQSLYLGRPISMQLRDAHVSTDFMDTMEELDLWVPYVDPEHPDPASVLYNPTPYYSVSTFQQLCHLSKLMTRIINRFYSVNANPTKAQASLDPLDKGLHDWYEGLPETIAFQPWSRDPVLCRKLVPPNVMNLHATYHSLVILLHRPFISDGHLRTRSAPASSWKKCTVAARHITSIVEAYRYAYSLRGAPYLTGYASYVACTIHVRNAALEKDQGNENSRLLLASLRTLDELSVPNPGVARAAHIIRRLMQTNGITEATGIISSPVEEYSYSLDMNTSPESIALSSLFDTFAQQEGQTMGTVPGLDQPILENEIHDSLFGFMDDTGLQIPLGGTDGFQS